MSELIFFKPFFKQVLWGGHKMKDFYGYSIPGDDTGEAWVISSNPHGQSIVRGGTYDGKSLGELWEHHRELFGGIEGAEFPLLVKVLDANDHLSIQVHPDDDYAFRHEQGGQGKTECWYILDCQQNADIIIGHRAKTRKELEQMIGEGRWDELLRKLPIHKGDFFYIPAGTVHAIRKGTLLLEVQQNSDTTYRLYDYGRLQNGEPRKLHLRQSMDVITCPHMDQNTAGPVISRGGYEICTLAEGPYFTVTKWNIKAEASLEQKYPFMLIHVISGEGTLDDQAVKAGDHLLVPAGYGTIHAQGHLELITTH
ncbi:MAG: mannose-6-phosphate isomerase, class I [Hungatella sp.]|nr:mannose-6-phosphate isomerase, class I [Hungatella sp.]MCI9502493.1 mannose-6-phosphate isomerase, class I [Hungatella sp.]